MGRRAREKGKEHMKIIPTTGDIKKYNSSMKMVRRAQKGLNLTYNCSRCSYFSTCSVYREIARLMIFAETNGTVVDIMIRHCSSYRESDTGSMVDTESESIDEAIEL